MYPTIYITYYKYYKTNIFVWRSGLKTCFHTDCLHSNYHVAISNEKYFLFCDLVWKHRPVYIISQTKCTTNIFVWRSGLQTQFHADRRHSNYQMLTRKAFFVPWLGMKIFYSVYYQSQVQSKYFCLMVRLGNIIPWRLSVTTIYTYCRSIIHLSENIFCFMALLENILQFVLSGKSVWRSGLKVWFCGDYLTTIIHLKWKVSFVWYQAAMILKPWYGACLFIYIMSLYILLFTLYTFYFPDQYSDCNL